MTEPLTFLLPRIYGKTQPDSVFWTCPDCGGLVDVLVDGRALHDAWHSRIDRLERRPR